MSLEVGKSLKIKGARVHNLKNVSLDLPKNKLILFTGLSGSGKSSLAFDTIYAEGQRRYVESLSTYARQFLSLMDKPDVDSIEGLSPAISIEQKSTSHNPRSTVGTVTEIHDYLRLLFARIGEPLCPSHQLPLKAQTISEMVDFTLAQPQGKKAYLIAPVAEKKKGEFVQLLNSLKRQGFLRVRIDGQMVQLDTETPQLDLHKKHTIEVVIDRFKIRPDLAQRLADSLETGLKLTQGKMILEWMDGGEAVIFSQNHSCSKCGYALSELEPRLFSFNSPVGACQHCSGLGQIYRFDHDLIVNQELSINQGAINGFTPHHDYNFKRIQSVCQHFDISLDTPFHQLSPSHQKSLLHGSDEVIDFRIRFKNKNIYQKKAKFEGVIPYFERRYNQTEVQLLRDSLTKYMRYQPCSHCLGQRLNTSALNVKIKNTNIADINHFSITHCFEFFDKLKLNPQQTLIAQKVLQEIKTRLKFLTDVGLGYLNLSRSAETLSGGESQRIRLASQIGSGLTGILYVLDEPSIGLHQRDNQRLLNTLFYLRDLGNTVIVVEHDEEAILNSDYIVDIGPKAGIHGGEIVAQGSLKEVKNHPISITAQYLNGKKKIEALASKPFTFNRHHPTLQLKKAKGHNLQSVDLTIPLATLTCITGVSGSGKSTLINHTLYPVVHNKLNKSHLNACDFDEVIGLDAIDKVININQSPIGRTPRSNPATYIGLFTLIRELFAQTPDAKIFNYKAGRFSFNVKGGRCEACQGDGLIKVEMHFLPDVYVECEACLGKRYNRETLEVRYKNHNIAQVLDLTVEDALHLFKAYPSIAKKLQTLQDVGLDYIKLGQSATTLSGGEAQRIKLAKELAKRDTGKTLYILDEPTTGLHFHDVDLLLQVLRQLQKQGNTIVVIEHNLDVIKNADWVVDLGPEGGDGGGKIVAMGTPQEVSQIKASYTGCFLKKMFEDS